MRTTLFIALGLCAPSALAQEAGRDVIVVTALGPPRSGDELIVNTTVLETDAIIERLNGGLGDTLAGLPGVSSTAFGPGASRPIIRGLGSERVVTLTNGIGAIDASAASPDHQVTADPLGAERIEVLRGPASLAYGGGAVGGVVNVIDGLIRETPDALPVSGVYGAYTSADAGIAGALRAEARSGRGGVVVALSGRRGSDLSIPGYSDAASIHEGEHDDDGVSGVLQNSFVRVGTAAAGWSVATDRGFAGVSLRSVSSRYGVPGHAHDDHDEPHSAALGFGLGTLGDLASLEDDDAVVDGEPAPFIVLEQVRLEARAGALLDSGPVRRLRAGWIIAGYQHEEFEAEAERAALFENDGWEGRLEAELDAPAGAIRVIGVQGMGRDFGASGEEAFLSPTRTRQGAVFYYQRHEFGSWGVEAGGRLDRTEVRRSAGLSREFSSVNASIGAHAHLSDTLFAGISLSRSERAPTDIELFADGPHLATRQYEIGAADLKTETSVSMDAVLRWTRGDLESSLSVYGVSFDRFIYFRPMEARGDGLAVYAAALSGADFSGFEWTGAVPLGRGLGGSWRLEASADAVRADIDGFGPAPRIPPLTLSATLKGRLARADLAFDLRRSVGQRRIASGETPTDGWTEIGFSAVIPLAVGVRLLAEGRNLTDAEIRIHESYLKDLAPQSGRSFRLALLADF
jgi:iron complex outermembrane receptor protein